MEELCVSVGSAGSVAPSAGRGGVLERSSGDGAGGVREDASRAVLCRSPDGDKASFAGSRLPCDCDWGIIALPTKRLGGVSAGRTAWGATAYPLLGVTERP